MSWKSRRKKAFSRYVELLKELPIYLIDHYIVIDESFSYYKENKMNVDYKAIKKVKYEEFLKSGKIKSSLDFDNYFNPDLTLYLTFEKDKKRANLLIKKTLIEIGKRWYD